ncbi:APC family permease [Alicyclobacillus tolerans]|uniref:Amino acid transporter n=1 Tax=Alicyclobacillus tolerans TaxID=90970 RepID=A0ABT9LX43_9BACL|nr:APC family permease [Alicyclobacillus tengchongensis]MDP9728835.1 amino acid transporter [Alicyclobacillus tengchongensis]
MPVTSSSSEGIRQLGLREGSISFWGALAISFGNMAPAASVLFLPQAMAQFTGSAVPLVFVFAMVASFLTAASILHFARRFASAGAAYAFNSLAFGKVLGFLSGWMLALAYGLALPSNLLVFGYFAQGFTQQVFGEQISWLIFSLCGIVAVTYLVIRGIRTSARVDLFLIIVETAIVLGLAIAIIVQGGANGNTWAVFSPYQSPSSWTGIIFGMLYGVGAFAGFEASATVAEETKNRFKAIPAAIFAALILGGLLYIVVSYAIAIGYGVHGGGRLAHATLPLSSLAIHFVGQWMALVVDFAGMISALGISLASANASARVLFTMGRDGVIPRWFSHLHQRFGTPHHAALMLTGVSTLLLFVVSFAKSPYPAGFSYLVEASDILGLSLYVLINIAWIRLWKKDQHHFHMGWLVGTLPSALGAIVMFIPLVSTIYPIPAWPLNLVLYLTALFVLTGVIVALWLKKNRPETLTQAGQASVSSEYL